MKKKTALFMSALMFLAGCTKGETTMNYQHITQQEAYSIMKDETAECIILDVRTLEEFNESHIPNAICVPNETIKDTQPEQLPDLSATILVYCRSGRRSADAAGKLAKIGYTDIREFGGIIEWPYEVE